MSDSPRHIARVVVLKTLYAMEHSDADLNSVFPQIAKEENLKDKHASFSRELAFEVQKRTEWTDEIIELYAENWTLERIAAIDRIILRMAMVELETFIDIPYKVVINEAIELAKEFSTAESSRFINGILDKFVKQRILEDKKN